jgi:hypothetical protein
VTITLAPGATASSDSARIEFRADEAGSSFSCRLDGGADAPCASPSVLTGLGVGEHVFSVRATDKAGNTGKPASVSWTYTPPDTTPPTVTIASAPPASTTDTSASFTFTASESGVVYECALDAAAYTACASPASYTSLGVGEHSFSVRGRDPAGNLGQPATFAWSIVSPPRPLPDLQVASFTTNTITIANRGGASAGASVLTITPVGTFTVPALAPGAVATFSWSTCRVGTYSAIVDRTNVVAESDETNNTASRVNTCR